MKKVFNDLFGSNQFVFSLKILVGIFGCFCLPLTGFGLASTNFQEPNRRRLLNSSFRRIFCSFYGSDKRLSK